MLHRLLKAMVECLSVLSAWQICVVFSSEYANRTSFILVVVTIVCVQFIRFVVPRGYLSIYVVRESECCEEILL